eukprot:TRINITY_DN2892_c0_g1_i1.p1 TRINITY_DN2892_c0_g1~~TRINITY_DN2892_c0_g1_i1.p1  ORF type:complete len:483 (-),score=135.36 TRINITY_DN2892_c0_g1_i1:397-1845(-)
MEDIVPEVGEIDVKGGQQGRVVDLSHIDGPILLKLKDYRLALAPVKEQYEDFDGESVFSALSGKPLIKGRSKGGDILEKRKGAGILPSIWNVVNNAIGAGVLAIPVGFRDSGYIAGGILLAVIAYLSCHTMSLYCKMSVEMGTTSLKELIKKAFGIRAAQVADLSIMIFALGATTAYVIVTGDLLPELVEKIGIDNFLSERGVCMAMMTMVLMLPLSLLKTMKALAWTSFMAVVVVCYVAMVVLIEFIKKADSEEGLSDSADTVNFNTLIKAIPMILFAYFIQGHIIKIFQELKNRTVKRANIVINCGVTIVAVVYVFIGCLGYLTFGADTEDNILTNYSVDKTHVAFAQLGVVFIVCVSFPIWMFACRLTLENLIYGDKSTEAMQQKPGQEDFFAWPRHIILTVILTAISLGLGLVFPDVGVVFGIFGVSPIYVGFILPFWGAIRILKLPLWKVRVYWSLIVICSVLGVIALGLNVKALFD